MASFKFSGLDEYTARLKRLADPKEYSQYIGKAVYVGAGIIADAVRANIQSIPTTRSSAPGTPENPIDGIAPAQKAGLLNGFGVSPMQDSNGYYNVKIGFNGYNSIRTPKYPSGQPNAVIARSVESGTSFRKKHPFVAPAVKAAKERAETMISETLDAAINDIMED